MRREPLDRGDDPEREELVRLTERAIRDLGISVPKLCFELRREVMRRKALDRRAGRAVAAGDGADTEGAAER